MASAKHSSNTGEIKLPKNLMAWWYFEYGQKKISSRLLVDNFCTYHSNFERNPKMSKTFVQLRRHASETQLEVSDRGKFTAIERV